MDRIYRETMAAVRKCDTRDPYDLLDAIGAITRVTDGFDTDGLKGFAMIRKRTMYAVINGKLDETEQRMIAGHEAAHLILHRQELLTNPAKAMKDFNLFGGAGRLEYQANRFLADFLVPDETVLDAVLTEGDYFAIAQRLYLSPDLLGDRAVA